MLHSLYQACLKRYGLEENNGTSLFATLFRGGVGLAVRFLTWYRGVVYPDRKSGGWYWVERYRFEFLMGWLEFDEVRICRKLIRPGMTVLDIGAHIGYYSMLFSRLVGPHGRVIAFEPNPENFEIAKLNILRAGYRNVEVYPFGVCETTGPRTLHVSPGHSNHSLMPGFVEAQGTIEVPCVALDDFLPEHGVSRVGFIKSDTEGAEQLVVQGALSTIANAPGLSMLVEYNPRALECGPTTGPELVRTLAGVGFVCKAILPGERLGDIPPLSGYEYVNLLCRKP